MKMSSSQSSFSAWLENAAGKQFPLAGNCSLGRSSDNTIAIAGSGASRRHAVIHAQEGEELWVIDLGSINGTLLNGRRVTKPMRLRSGDRLSIADTHFTFHQRQLAEKPGETPSMNEPTMIEIRNVPCWLLVADLANFTPLSQQLSPDQLAEVVGGWLRTCKDAIERHGGAINKYLGDGFMAYWIDAVDAREHVAATLSDLRTALALGTAEFRAVVHHGLVALGGTASLGEESLMGKEVNFAFRMEKLGAALGVAFCVSEAAQALLGSSLSLKPIAGTHELKGFGGTHRFFQLV
jgi:class 3 adenylate cyclase